MDYALEPKKGEHQLRIDMPDRLDSATLYCVCGVTHWTGKLHTKENVKE